jgi:site-specific DNA-methyltransferase (adenine-specific)
MTLQEIKQHIGIKPYFETELGVLYCADCLQIMQSMPDKCVDLVLTDPPYGIKADDNPIKGKFFHNSISFDKERPSQAHFDNLKRVGKNCIIWGGNYFTDYLYPSMGWIVWNKRKNFSLADSELAWTSFNKAIRKFDLNPTTAKARDFNFHPTQKSVDLIIFCVKYGGEGLILDPFLGSGTTAVACEKLGRQWIGVEISEKYCEIAKKRIDNEARQKKLFV